MDVTTWLQEVGLERHEAVFRDNLIDMDVVRELTENDLEKLGLALGDRKRVMKAIASLPALETVLPPTPISAATRTRDEAERPCCMDARGGRYSPFGFVIMRGD
jgi:hypothetical protein